MARSAPLRLLLTTAASAALGRAAPLPAQQSSPGADLVREAGQGGQLNTFPEFAVAFWRWAICKLCEAENAPERGVVAVITNRKLLTGWPYAGLRHMMRQRCERI